LAEAPSLHRYAYARVNPLRWWDPLGFADVDAGTANMLAARRRKLEQGIGSDREAASDRQLRARQADWAWEESYETASVDEQTLYDIGEISGGNNMARAYTGGTERAAEGSAGERVVDGAVGVTEAAGWATTVSGSLSKAVTPVVNRAVTVGVKAAGVVGEGAAAAVSRGASAVRAAAGRVEATVKEGLDLLDNVLSPLGKTDDGMLMPIPKTAPKPVESKPFQMAAKKPIDKTRSVHGGDVEHDATAFNKAKEWEAAPETAPDSTRFNQGLVDADGNPIPGFRPDDQRVRVLPDGTKVVDVVEVQSPTQNKLFMDNKVKAMQQALGPQAGDVRWIPPIKGAARKP